MVGLAVIEDTVVGAGNPYVAWRAGCGAAELGCAVIYWKIGWTGFALLSLIIEDRSLKGTNLALICYWIQIGS